MTLPIRKTLLAAVVGLTLSPMAMARPNVHILATGGTIAGAGQSATQSNYEAGKVAIETLIAAVPEMKNVADVQGEQVVKIGSQDMNDEVWLKLAKRVNELLAKDDVDGIVITHGTDTMEETAYFLNLTVKSDKPVVLVGAMRPSTAMSADGPMNLYNAVVTASDPASKGRGVMVAMNDTVLDARDVTKTNTTGVQTFASPNFGPLGYIHNGKIDYQRSPARLHTSKTPFDVSKLDKLPQVGIVYSYAPPPTCLPRRWWMPSSTASSAPGWATATSTTPCSTPWLRRARMASASCAPPACRPAPPPWMPRSMMPSTASWPPALSTRRKRGCC